MRYMLLIYSRPGELSIDEEKKVRRTHHELMNEARSLGVLLAAEPLTPARTATTVRKKDGDILVSDGPFTETKEQLAGYYILDCQTLDEAIEWARRIPTSCHGDEGCIEIRSIRER